MTTEERYTHMEPGEFGEGTMVRRVPPPPVDAPHTPAAFINAIREEGTKAEACDWLQKTWNELVQLKRAQAHSWIKPLEWEEDEDGQSFTAVMIYGRFWLQRDKSDEQWALRLDYVSGDQVYQSLVGTYDLVDLGKAAAETMYRTSILETVEVLDAADVKARIKQAVGECLAGMDHRDVSPAARRRIEAAIDNA